MRVALDCGPLLDPPTGVGRYTRELARALEARGTDVVRYAVAARRANAADGSMLRWRVPARLAQASWRMFGRPPIERLTGGVDVVHATNFVLPALRSTPGAVTVHDLSFERDDVWPGGKRLRDLVAWSVRRAAVVITPTQTVADEVAERYGVSEDSLAVTHEGVSPVFFGATPLSGTALSCLGIRGPFFVAVGTIEPRKNLQRLVDAWRTVRRDLSEHTLVIAGPQGWGRELQVGEGVVLAGWVSEETLPGLLAAAEGFCYPSLYEGFGLPPLEAMAAGTPALVGAYAAAIEVLGDAALLVDPVDVGALAEGLVALGTDEALRTKLKLSGRARATTYTWEQAAKATEAAYRRAVESE